MMHKLICDICASDKYVKEGFIIPIWTDIRSGFGFLDALNFIIDNSSVFIDNITRKTPKTNNIIDWEQLFGKYLKHENNYAESKIYNESILNFFPKIYHQSWIDDGITIETMEKFGICYYPYKQQIVIPVHNEDGEFIGCHCRNLVQEVVDRGYKYMPLKLLDGTQYKFSTSMVLYGLWENKENIIKTKTVKIFESQKRSCKWNLY